jgi:hypothetical protein
MSLTLLHGCFQIELTVRDLGRWRSFMEGVLGAAPIEQRFAEELQAVVPDGFDIDNIDCGGATFQPNQPSPTFRSDGYRPAHVRYLEDVGPCVTNLNWCVDDIGHAKQLLHDLGAGPFVEGPSTLVSCLADYGPENTRPGASTRPFLFVGTRDLFGFDLEIMEPNFAHFVQQDVQRPCFYGKRTGVGVEGLRLQRLVVVVPDLEATYANLVEAFTPGSRSNPYAIRDGVHGRAFRISLGGIELEYCQPTTTGNPLAERLERYGTGVVDAVFGVPVIDSVLDRLAGYPEIEVSQRGGPLEGSGTSGQWVLSTREEVGFDIVLVELDGRALTSTP